MNVEGLSVQREGLYGFERTGNILSLSQKTERRVPYLLQEAADQVGQVSNPFWP